MGRFVLWFALAVLAATAVSLSSCTEPKRVLDGVVLSVDESVTPEVIDDFQRAGALTGRPEGLRVSMETKNFGGVVGEVQYVKIATPTGEILAFYPADDFRVQNMAPSLKAACANMNAATPGAQTEASANK